MLMIYLQMLETDEERSKFEKLYYKYRSMMYAVALSRLRNQHDAEDAVHEAFLSIIKHFKKVSQMPCPDLEPYIVIIVENKAIDILRLRKRVVDIDYIDTIEGIHIPEPGDNGLADALSKLPARYREILLLRFNSGYKTRELAELMDMSQETVQKLVWRAREALKTELDEDGKKK